MNVNALSCFLRHQFISRSIVVAGTIIFSPLIYAAEYTHTVDLANQTINANDSIKTSDIHGIISGSSDTTGLQLGSGKIGVTVNGAPANNDTPVIGINLVRSASPSHTLGTGSSINVSGDYHAYGVRASDNIHVSGSNLTINTQGVNSTFGIVGGTNGVLNLGADSVINTTSSTGLATSVTVASGGSLLADNLQVVTTGGFNNTTSILTTATSAAGTTVELGNGGKIVTVSQTDNDNSSAAIATNGNTTVKANGLVIESTNAYGIRVNGGKANINLGNNSYISTTGNDSSGISLGGAVQGSDLTANGLTISTTGQYAYGLNLNTGTNRVNLGSHSSITTTGNNAHGIWYIGSSGMKFDADALTVHTKGDSANALEIGSGTMTIGGGSTLISEKAGGVKASKLSLSKDAPTVNINDTKIISWGQAVSAQQAGTVVNLNRVDASALGSTYGFWAAASGVINATDTSLLAQNSYAMVANGGGKINLTGGVKIDTDRMAMIADSSTSWIKGNGLMQINGDLQAQNNGLIDLTMTSGSALTGMTNQSSAGLLNLAMENSRWNMAADSVVNNLQLTKGSTVAFTGTTTPNGTLRVTHLSGDGHFAMRSSIVEGAGDLLSVSGTTTGNHQVSVLNNGSEATNGTEVLTIIETADGGGNFALTNKVELGGYLYDLQQTGNDWQLYASGTVPPKPDPEPEPTPDPDPTPDPTPDPGTNKPNPPITSTANASANSLNVGYLMNYAETQTLMQRMGQLRTDGIDGNLWLRGYYGNFTSFGRGKLSGFDMTYNGVQLGADKQWQSASGMMYLGAALGQSNSNQDYQNGDGDMRNRHVGLYAGYLDNSGLYVDTLLKYNRMRNEINVKDTAGNGVDGSASSNGISLSVEAGKRFHFTPENSGFYIEPQSQLTVAWQDSSHFKNSNGLKVDLSSYTSTLGRVGGLIGYEVTEGATPVNFYLKSSYVHEFNGDADYRLNGNKEAHSFKGDWWANGVGASVGIGKQHNLYLDLEQVSGSQFKQSQINGGYRFSF